MLDLHDYIFFDFLHKRLRRLHGAVMATEPHTGKPLLRRPSFRRSGPRTPLHPQIFRGQSLLRTHRVWWPEIQLELLPSTMLAHTIVKYQNDGCHPI